MSAPSPRRIAVHHLGCKLNQYEAEALSAGFAGRGFAVVPFGAEADVYVVNTCTVTGSGDADSRKAVRRARRANPEALVVATGCYAQRRPDELTDAGAGLVVGNADKAGLVDTVAARLADAPTGSPLAELPRVDAPGFDPQIRPRTERFLQIDGAVDGGRTRGTLQIQDGCDEHCTYCIIPSVRGPGVSRPAEQILQQARTMVDAGYRELALTGVHSGSFGHDTGSPDALVDLLVALESIDGLARIRLNSVEPNTLTDALIDHAAASSRFCRHFHVPLQSGSDAVLKRMGRRYDTAHYAERIGRIAEAIPGCAIGADVMVGFPGETAADHETALAFVDALPLTYLHVFSYSLRADTPAERLRDHVSRQAKTERARQLIERGHAKRLAFHRAHLDTTVQVLVEDVDDAGLATGLTDNYIRVRFAAQADTARNRMAAVRLTQAREDVAFGVVGVKGGADVDTGSTADAISPEAPRKGETEAAPSAETLR